MGRTLGEVEQTAHTRVHELVAQHHRLKLGLHVRQRRLVVMKVLAQSQGGLSHVYMVFRQSLNIVVPCGELLLLPREDVGQQNAEVKLLWLEGSVVSGHSRKLTHISRLLRRAFKASLLLSEKFVDKMGLCVLWVLLIEHRKGRRCQGLVVRFRRLQNHRDFL